MSYDDQSHTSTETFISVATPAVKIAPLLPPPSLGSSEDFLSFTIPPPPVQSNPPSVIALPPGWAEKVDPATGRKYYAHKDLRFTQWIWPSPSDTPPPLPADWEQRSDPLSGKLYFVNPKLCKSQWGRPGFTTNTTIASVGSGWRECQDVFGKTYYHNQVTKEVRRRKPEESQCTPEPTITELMTPPPPLPPPLIVPPPLLSTPPTILPRHTVSVHLSAGMTPLPTGTKGAAIAIDTTPISTPTQQQEESHHTPDSPTSIRSRSLSSGAQGKTSTTPNQPPTEASSPSKKPHLKFSIFRSKKRSKEPPSPPKEATNTTTHEENTTSQSIHTSSHHPPLVRSPRFSSPSTFAHPTPVTPFTASLPLIPSTQQSPTPKPPPSTPVSAPSSPTALPTKPPLLPEIEPPSYLQGATLPSLYTRGSRMSLPPGLLRRV
ncbi:hypothetical protein Pelo_4556 [Pelomyxa schiedti]|nr:hypothetical protein Pelo_4556 [Pelomyxa schiedti]